MEAECSGNGVTSKNSNKNKDYSRESFNLVQDSNDSVDEIAEMEVELEFVKIEILICFIIIQ